MTFQFKALAAVAVLAISGGALAQKAGSLSVSVGVTNLKPDVTSGDLSAPTLPGSKVDVGGNTQLTGAVNYMVLSTTSLVRVALQARA
jgi:outer membrane protein